MSHMKHALGWAGSGWAVGPLRGKEPITTHGVKDFTRDYEQIRAWWAEHPDANIGGVPPARLVVLDIDPRNGGEQTLAALEAEHGKLPATHTHITGRGDGGRHLIFRVPAGVDPKVIGGKLGPGIDVIVGPNKYIVLPPSIHPEGDKGPYREADDA